MAFIKVGWLWVIKVHRNRDSAKRQNFNNKNLELMRNVNFKQVDI